MAAEYICVCVFLNLMTLFYVIIEINEVVAIFKCLKHSLKGRELVLAVLVRLLNCLCSSIKK